MTEFLNHTEMARTKAGRHQLFKVLQTGSYVLGNMIESDNTVQMTHEIPKLIQILNAIQIGVLEQI